MTAATGIAIGPLTERCGNWERHRDSVTCAWGKWHKHVTVDRPDPDGQSNVELDTETDTADDIVSCVSWGCEMNRGSCITARVIAERAARMIVSGVSLNRVNQVHIDRLLVCGECGMWVGKTVEVEAAIALVKADVELAIDTVVRWKEESKGEKSETEVKAAAYKRYMDKAGVRERRAEYMRERRRKIAEGTWQ